MLACTPHIWKSGGYKKNFRSLRSRIMFCPLTFRIAAPPLYVGEPLEELRPHGNSKDQQGRPFMRTPAQTLQSISSRVTSQQCKSVYDNLVAESDLLDAPRDSRVVLLTAAEVPGSKIRNPRGVSHSPEPVNNLHSPRPSSESIVITCCAVAPALC